MLKSLSVTSVVMLWMEAKKQEKEKEITEDQLKTLEKDIQKATDDAVNKIDSMIAEKEKELLTV